LSQISGQQRTGKNGGEIIADNPQAAADFNARERDGDEVSGRTIYESKQRAGNPQIATQLLKNKLGANT